MAMQGEGKWLSADCGALKPADAQPFTARPPVEPVTFGSLAAGAVEDEQP